MRIGIDISALVYGRGVSRYKANLVRSLLELRQHEVFAFGTSLRQKKLLKDFVDAQRPPFAGVALQSYPPTVLDLLWKFGKNSISQNLPNLDVFHSWDWLQPPDKNLPIVSTIHDIAILRFPETAHPKVVAMHQRAWRLIKERQTEIIAVSQATKRDIVELLQIPSFLVHVVPEALPTETTATALALSEERYEAIKKQLTLDRPYLFFVGTREPRKNLMTLIKAWKPLSKDVDLLIAGDAGWDETSSNAPTENGLRFLGRVTDEELVVLYAEATCFVFPSLYEGFGLPILEAFYHGTPVVTSDVPALQEVAGNAAVYVQPKDQQSIRDGIRTVLNEDIDAQRKRLQRMVIRSQMFNWQKVAENTVHVYQTAWERRQ